MFLEECEWVWEKCDARHWLLLRMDKEERMADGRGMVECSREQQRIGEEMRRCYTLGLGWRDLCGYWVWVGRALGEQLTLAVSALLFLQLQLRMRMQLRLGFFHCTALACPGLGSEERVPVAVRMDTGMSRWQATDGSLVGGTREEEGVWLAMDKHNLNPVSQTPN